MGIGFTLREFSDVFRVRNPAGQRYVLIGGQAVNYWAERYLGAEPALKKHLPFTSEDIDFCGGRKDVEYIARQLNRPPVFPPKVAMTALAGAIPFQIGETNTTIEIVRSIPGVTARDVEALAVEMEWNRKVIRVLDPISLLICKIELALTVSQAKRQDIAHLKILLLCVCEFLREMLPEVEAGNVPAKAWLGAVNRLARLAKSSHGRKAAKKFGIVWSELLPVSAIVKSKVEKVRLFSVKQVTGRNWPSGHSTSP